MIVLGFSFKMIIFIFNLLIFLSQTVIIKDEELKGLRWIYPIYGIPEAPPNESAPGVNEQFKLSRRKWKEHCPAMIQAKINGIVDKENLVQIFKWPSTLQFLL